MSSNNWPSNITAFYPVITHCGGIACSVGHRPVYTSLCYYEWPFVLCAVCASLFFKKAKNFYLSQLFYMNELFCIQAQLLLKITVFYFFIFNIRAMHGQFYTIFRLNEFYEQFVCFWQSKFILTFLFHTFICLYFPICMIFFF